MKTIFIIFLMSIFSTALASNTSTIDRMTLEDEAYVDDIPFNTKSIFGDSIRYETVNLKLNDEPSVNDISFDTFVVFQRSMKQIDAQLNNLPDEDYIDDIPFDTFLVASVCISSGITTRQ